MAIIKSLRGKTPKIGSNCFIAETAVIIGDVTIGDNCSIWYGAVLRGDVNSITIGNNVNIQDNSVLHTLYERSEVKIGNNVSVGHLCNIHGAQIGNNVLVGMGSTLMDNANIPDNTIVAAGALVLSNAELENMSIYAGVPAKKVKTLNSEDVERMIVRNAKGYLMYKDWYL
ncbi:MAG: gamma carbonic anhydrase family protein [Bacteroidales bacterium]